MLQNSQRILGNVQLIDDQRQFRIFLSFLLTPLQNKTVEKKCIFIFKDLSAKQYRAKSEPRVSRRSLGWPEAAQETFLQRPDYWKRCARSRSREKGPRPPAPRILLQEKLQGKLSPQSRTQKWQYLGKGGKPLRPRREMGFRNRRAHLMHLALNVSNGIKSIDQKDRVSLAEVCLESIQERKSRQP